MPDQDLHKLVLPRSIRRAQRLRMIQKAQRSLKLADMDETDRAHWSLRRHDHLATCSCWMCGNTRKYDGEKTIQERRLLVGQDRVGFGLDEELD